MTNIVFAHRGNSWYLDNVLNRALRSNPDANIILLGDEENRFNKFDQTPVSKWPLDEFLEKRDKSNVLWAHYTNFGPNTLPDAYYDLLTNYVHIGTETGKKMCWKHQFCFGRWYLLLDLMDMLGSIWYFDSDTLICNRLSDLAYWYKDCDAWIINRISGCAAYFQTKEMLKQLCQKIYDMRNDEEYIKTKKQALRILQEKGKNYNMCDMSIISEWNKENKGKVGDLSKIKNGGVFDPNINCATADQRPDCLYEFEMEECKGRPIKKVYFVNNVPYFKIIKKKDNLEIVHDMIRAHTLNMSWFDYRKNVFIDIYRNLIK